MAYWINNLDPFVLRFHGEWGIRYYGLAYAAAFAAAYGVLHYLHRKGRSPLDGNAIHTVVLYVIIGVLIGGRLGYMVLYDTHFLWKDPLAVFKVWQGGMSSHGGFIGALAACCLAARKTKSSFWQISDLLCLVAPIGLFLGRVANFINGELWGRVSNAPWAVIFPRSAPPGTPAELIAPRHPSQLYEASLEGLLPGLFIWWRFYRAGSARTPGRLTGEFLLAYALLRIFGEQFREPDASLIFGLSRGVFYSLFLLATGIIILILRSRKPKGGNS